MHAPSNSSAPETCRSSAGEPRQATPMSEQSEAARRFYAEELRFAARLRSPSLVAAFATVPRERFVGAGPWRIRSPKGIADYWTTEDADPRHLYRDVLVALDEAHGINNGQPSLWAFLSTRSTLPPARMFCISVVHRLLHRDHGRTHRADRKNHGRRDRSASPGGHGRRSPPGRRSGSPTRTATWPEPVDVVVAAPARPTRYYLA